MNRYNVSTHRRFREGLRWPSDTPPRRIKIRHAIEVAAGILILLGFHGWAQYMDADAALQEQIYRTKVAASNLAACMNGGAVYDRATDTAHFCERVHSVVLGSNNLSFR